MTNLQEIVSPIPTILHHYTHELYRDKLSFQPALLRVFPKCLASESFRNASPQSRTLGVLIGDVALVKDMELALARERVTDWDRRRSVALVAKRSQVEALKVLPGKSEKRCLL